MICFDPGQPEIIRQLHARKINCMDVVIFLLGKSTMGNDQQEAKQFSHEVILIRSLQRSLPAVQYLIYFH